MSRKQDVSRLVGAVLAAGLLAFGTAPTSAGAAAAGGTTTRVSVSTSGAQAAGGMSSEPQVSATGRYVAFFSEAPNLVPGDTNGFADVFVRDRLAGTTRRVSVGPGGVQANERSFAEAMSADGRYVVFTSTASNLVAGDTNGATDLFVRDVQAGLTQRVSLNSAGGQADAGTINFATAISADGRYIAFSSTATNLVHGDTNGPFGADVFLRDRVNRTTQRVSVSAAGQQVDGDSFAAGVSRDGRYVLFSSFASNVVPGDTNFSGDAFIRDRQARTTKRVSVGAGGQQALEGNSSAQGISADGRFVLFTSSAANLVTGDTNDATDVFVRDRQAGVTRRVSLNTGGRQANGSSFNASMSADGRYISIDSQATNLAPGDTNGQIDVFVRDRLAGTTRRVSVSSAGVQANGESFASQVSADGRHVGFASDATNLVAGDRNAVIDVFVRDEFGDVG